MKTLLTYVFSNTVFNIKKTETIEFENPPFIPETKELIDIDYHHFFDEEIADEIGRNLEDDKLLLPYKTNQVWNADGVHVLYEFMNPDKLVKR